MMSGAVASSDKNGNGHNRRGADHLLYEHGVAIADLAARTTSLEDFRKEMKPVLEAVQIATTQNSTAMALAVSKLESAVGKINDRAWTAWRVMCVGAVVFVAACGAVAWLMDTIGVTIHFGG